MDFLAAIIAAFAIAEIGRPRVMTIITTTYI
jgi:hypothetical protein